MDPKLNTCTGLGSVHRTNNLQTAEGEVARWTWRFTDSVDSLGLADSDPWPELEAFLAEFALPVRATALGFQGKNDQLPPEVTGKYRAQLFISAVGCAVLAGSPAAKLAARSPTPQIPDIVAVVQENPPQQTSLKPTERDLSVGQWVPAWSEAEHMQAIEQVKAAIAAGDVYQVNLVGHHSAPYRGNPLLKLHEISQLPGAVYGGLLCGENWAVATATPELLVSIDFPTGLVTTKPIKGTRSATADGRAELLSSEKERAEHIMIVDLMRNDLSRIGRINTVQVPQLFSLREWSGLWQAESTVTTQLRHEVTLTEVLRAVCPGGSVTGAPKLAALNLISTLEPVGRGPAMGAMGWLTSDRLTLGLTIRTVAATPDRFHLWAGGGITYSSDPRAEVLEAAAKARPLKTLL